MRWILSILIFLSLSSSGQVIRANAFYRPFAAPSNFLLDNYGGAAAAYSLRKISSTATNAIRVRRSNDNSEQDIGFLSSGELDTTSLKTFVGANTGTVTTWYDQSGNGRNATQTTAGNQPVIVSAGVVQRVNGKPSVSMGAQSNQWWLNLPTGFLNAQTAMSWIGVIQVIDYAASNAGVFGPSTTNSVGLEILQHTVITRRSFLRINGTSRNDNSGAAYQLWADNAQNLTEIYGTSSAVSAYTNNTAVTLTNTNALPSLNFNGVYAMGMYNSGATNMFGAYQELIIYYSSQESNRSGIASNINSYYTIY